MSSKVAYKDGEMVGYKIRYGALYICILFKLVMAWDGIRIADVWETMILILITLTNALYTPLPQNA